MIGFLLTTLANAITCETR